MKILQSRIAITVLGVLAFAVMLLAAHPGMSYS